MEKMVSVNLTAEEARMIRIAIDTRIDQLEERGRGDYAKKYEELYEKFDGRKWK